VQQGQPIKNKKDKNGLLHTKPSTPSASAKASEFNREYQDNRNSGGNFTRIVADYSNVFKYLI
jgi:hypothetical protein